MWATLASRVAFKLGSTLNEPPPPPPSTWPLALAIGAVGGVGLLVARARR